MSRRFFCLSISRYLSYLTGDYFSWNSAVLGYNYDLYQALLSFNLRQIKLLSIDKYEHIILLFDMGIVSVNFAIV